MAKKGTAERIRKLNESAGRNLVYALREERKMRAFMAVGEAEMAVACLRASNRYMTQAKDLAQRALNLEE